MLRKIDNTNAKCSALKKTFKPSSSVKFWPGPPAPYGLNRQIMKINGCLLKYMINKLNTYRQKRVIKYLSKKLIKYIQLT